MGSSIYIDCITQVDFTKSLHNLSIFVTPLKRVDFSEVTGVRALSFRNVSMGNPQAPIYRGNAEGVKLPHGYVAEKTSPRALELKKSPPSLRNYTLYKALLTY